MSMNTRRENPTVVDLSGRLAAAGRLRPCRCQRDAFTLIELLMVVAILSLLVSILLPSLNKAKELAKKAICASNQRQIGLGIGMYSVENRRAFPAALHWISYWPGMPADRSAFVSWGHALFRPANAAKYYPYSSEYIDERMVFVCPKMTRALEMLEERGPGSDPWDAMYTNYGFYRSYAAYANQAGHEDAKYFTHVNYSYSSYTWTWRHWQLYRIPDMANFAFTGDVEAGSIETTQGGVDMSNLEFPSGRETRYAWMAHLGTANILFGDGHVQSYQPEGLTTFANGKMDKGGGNVIQGLYYYREEDGTEQVLSSPY